MKFGLFSDSAREYVITTPRTPPLPWINLSGAVRHSSALFPPSRPVGTAFYRDAKLGVSPATATITYLRT